MKADSLIIRLLSSIVALFLFHAVEASKPVWTLTPLTATTLSVPSNNTATVQYQVTNQSTKTHTLTMQSAPGITQLTTGLGICGNPFVLVGKASCTLSLQVNGSQLTQPITDGPIVCDQNSTLQCYRPASADMLRLTQVPPVTLATITVSNSPLTLTTNGPTGTLYIHNTSSTVTATNITSNFTNTALNGNITETGNTCSNLAPLHCCRLIYTPGSTVVSQTDFGIKGNNTNTITAAAQIDAALTLSSISPSSGSTSGATGVILTGTGLTGTTSVTFAGILATSVHVVNSTTVTAVTPAHASGVVDVVISTLAGSATLTNGYTYVNSAIGQSTGGGKIACLNGGLVNLIAATADNSTGVVWGSAITTGATSTTDGASNTTTIINTVGEQTPNAATICGDYEIDSQGNTPCELGNTCYNDWFLPAGNNPTHATGQLNCLYTNQVAIGGFNNEVGYWSSTESNNSSAWIQSFVSPGTESVISKSQSTHVRCVRNFTPS